MGNENHDRKLEQTTDREIGNGKGHTRVTKGKQADGNTDKNSDKNTDGNTTPAAGGEAQGDQ